MDIRAQVQKLFNVRGWSDEDNPIVWVEEHKQGSIQRDTRQFYATYTGKCGPRLIIYSAIEKMKADNFKHMKKYLEAEMDADQNITYVLLVFRDYANEPSYLSEELNIQYEILRPINLVNPYDRYDMSFVACRKLSDEEVSKLSSSYNLKVDVQLPKMKETDPLSIWNMWRAGDVVVVKDKNIVTTYIVVA